MTGPAAAGTAAVRSMESCKALSSSVKNFGLQFTDNFRKCKNRGGIFRVAGPSTERHFDRLNDHRSEPEVAPVPEPAVAERVEASRGRRVKASKCAREENV